MLSKLLRTSIISSTVAFLTLSVISSKSLAESYRTMVLTNNSEQPISRVRIRIANTKKWYQLMSLMSYLEVGTSRTFKVSTAQCKYTLVVDWTSPEINYALPETLVETFRRNVFTSFLEMSIILIVA
jgi:hypothetical protein